MNKKNSILIVDDDTSNLMELTHILKDEYKIHAVKNGVSALEKANEYLPDIILLDIVMPDMNGYEVLAQLKSSGLTRNIPVIFITGVTESNDEIKGLASGASDYIRKPFNETIVRLRVLHQVQIINQMRKIEQLSMSDQLTSLPNRRSFEKRMNEEWSRASRDKTPLSILMIDIDRFKKYNDTYGHQQGDAALCALAEVLTSTLKRSIDFAARWGGEEFIVLLPNTDINGASDVAQQIRECVQNKEILNNNKMMTKITVSIGINNYSYGSSGTIEDFIQKADVALYDAKNSGRNRVCLYK